MSQTLILTGMHRSATSLIASLLQGAGVYFGAQLLEPNSQNPRGFFEDIEFYDFHEWLLRSRNKTILVDRTFTFAPTPEEHAQANALLETRAQYELWGWKDPRTSLFLNFWREKIPDAYFLLVYRHPFDVLLSLMRRNQWHMSGLMEGLEAWYAYNRALTEFRMQYPQQTLLCNSYRVVDEIETFNAYLQEKFGLRLNFDASTRDAQYQPSELWRAALPLAAETILQQVHPDAGALYAHLNEIADLPATPFAMQASAPTPQLDALVRFSSGVDDTISARRSLLFALLSALTPEILETFLEGQTRELERLSNALDQVAAQRDAWRRTAKERARIIQEQQAWAQTRMADLVKLEAHPLVRALQRLGGV